MTQTARRWSAIAALTVAVVAIAATTSAARVVDTPLAVTVLSAEELDTDPLTDILETLQSVPDVQPYRFAADPSGPATLAPDVFPAVTPDLFGLAIIDPGNAGYAGLEDALRDSSIEFITSGEGLNERLKYAMFMATREVPTTPLGDPFAYNVQIDWPLSFANNPGWSADPAYPGDTWQGASLVLSTQIWIGEDPKVSLIDTNNGFQELPANAVVAIADDWQIALVDLDSLASAGELSGWAYASHVHDGSYGACESCDSIITSYPGVPRISTELNAWPTTTITLALPKPGADAEVSASPVASPDAAASTVAVSDAESDSDFALVWWILAFLLIAFGVGWWLWRRRSATPSSTE